MVRTTLNILSNLLDPGLRPTMVQKIRRRFLRAVQERESGAKEWAERRAQDHAVFCKELDEELWSETERYVEALAQEAATKLIGLPVMGGGGNYGLLYFVTRLLRPETVIETGVAYGFSTHAILHALEANGKGRLFSSEFPYFRLDDPTRYIGVLVPEALKHRWTLALDGDSAAIPRFLQLVDRVDLVHYDSDKTYAGRSEAFSRLTPRLSSRAAIIVDDIGDNFHFRDMVAKGAYESRVFGFQGKHCGLIERAGGPLLGVGARR